MRAQPDWPASRRQLRSWCRSWPLHCRYQLPEQQRTLCFKQLFDSSKCIHVAQHCLEFWLLQASGALEGHNPNGSMARLPANLPVALVLVLLQLAGAAGLRDDEPPAPLSGYATLQEAAAAAQALAGWVRCRMATGCAEEDAELHFLRSRLHHQLTSGDPALRARTVCPSSVARRAPPNAGPGGGASTMEWMSAAILPAGRAT